MRALPTDEECAFVEPFVVPVRSLGGGPACDRRPVPPAIFRIARLGAWWRDLPADPGRRKPAFRRFPRRAASGLRDVMLETLADGDGEAGLVQMIAGTTVRAHPCAAGARGLTAGVPGARGSRRGRAQRVPCAAASRAGSTSAAARMACPSPCIRPPGRTPETEGYPGGTARTATHRWKRARANRP